MTHRDVLVVDDDVATRVLLETLLSRMGLTVQTAADGEEAVKALNDCQVDAIITDLFMPRMNGIDLLESVTREHQELLPKVIVLSAAPEALLNETRSRYPIWCAMRKPADISDLIENVLDCVVHA
jgi:two-component system, NarL family, capsular synthesis sensor histidine kinase RcsC